MWNRDFASNSYLPRARGRLDFDNQVRRAMFVDGWRWLTGRRRDLVKFDDVVRWRSRHLRCPPQLTHVPIDHIVGSVGRSRDFTREFLPRGHVNPHRWESIDRLTQQGVGLPPADLFRVGDVYFVIDGHHRTSVARANGALTIDAVVITLESPVWLTIEDFQNESWMQKIAQQEG
jgi:hypothetical protein